MQKAMLGVLLYAELVGGVPSGLPSLCNQRLTLSCASYAAYEAQLRVRRWLHKEGRPLGTPPTNSAYNNTPSMAFCISVHNTSASMNSNPATGQRMDCKNSAVPW